MPTFEVSKDKLVKRIGRPISDEKLADRIAMMGAVVEKMDGDTWTIEAFPNRPDLLSEEGLARALRGFLGIETGLAKYKVDSAGYAAVVDKSVAGVREHVVAAVVKGVSIDEETLVSLMQMQEKLHTTHSRNRKLASIGVYDLDAIEFPVKYTTVRGDFKFVPLEYRREMTVSEILREHPKGKDYAHLLAGTNLYPIWIDARGQVLSLPPIINSAETAVTPDTKGVLIDVTGLNRRVVEQALHIIVAQLADAGGEAYLVQFGDSATPNMEPRKMRLDLGYCNSLLGLSLDWGQAKKLLEKMRYGVEGKDVLVPAYRTDVLHPIDLVEDIAIAYGYENFEPVIPQISTIGGEGREAIVERKVAEALAGFGFLECNTYHLTPAEAPAKMRAPAELVMAKNPVNVNYNAVRNSLLPGLLQILSENKHYDYPQRLFDIGRVVESRKSLKEEQKVAAVSCNARADFTEAKSLVESLLLSLGYEPSFKAVKHPSFLGGRSAAVVVNKKEVGVVGEIHPEALANFGVDLPVAAFEASLEALTS
ncbi:MAG: phenylalanine--tRNA ligase subunit beta [Candidatus Diapherotrites archaeon]|nr:phenylalanine--tRNA ligase subunit beta [Candidatus Diapherotrites archaeon]